MLDRRKLLAGGAAFAAAPAMAADDGVRMIEVPGGRVWTRRVGSGPVKVLVLHGGPAMSHRYLKPVGERLSQAGFEVYLYDQLGSGLSEHPDNPALWRLPRFVKEVEAVRRGLGLEGAVLYGQSWGGILATEYALTYPGRFRGLVISNMVPSAKSVERYLLTLKSRMPKPVQAELDAFEAKGDHTSEAYGVLMMREFNSKYICRLDPWPAEILEDLGGLNTQVYNALMGPSDFTIRGNIRHWDRWADVRRIAVPTLVLGAENDEIDPADVRKLGRLIPHAETWISRTGAHLTMWDDPEGYFGALIPFLRRFA